MRPWWAILVLVGCQPAPPLQEASAPPSSQPEVEIELEVPELPQPSVVVPIEEVMLGWWESSFFASDNRGKNILQAIARIEGKAYLLPGEEFSFNKVVGARTIANGFFLAPVIVEGEMDQGLGGGVCQVSSTLYAASLVAGLDVVERMPHSRPSKYMPPGLDATVTIPESCPQGGCYTADLRIKNTRSTPIRLDLQVDPPKVRGGLSTLRVIVQGQGEVPVRPRYSYGISQTSPFEIKIRYLRGKPSGFSKRKQKGSNGMVVNSTFTIGGKTILKTRSVYPPVDEIWEVSDLDKEAPPPWEIQDAGTPDGG